MKKIRLFKCGDCHEQQEKFVEDDTRTIDCICGKLAYKQLSFPKYFSNTTGKSPSAK